jgi:conjugal transfer mating pair stabilization protein TraN
LAAQVAILYIQSLASCDQSEQLLALHRGQNLSVFVGEQCVKKVLGSCIEWRNNYCSFNSVLAKIINTDGKKQLGQNLSNCSGISTDDLARIDFTQVDFSEFTSAVVNQATRNLPANINGNYTPLMQNASSGSSQGNNPVLPSY